MGHYEISALPWSFRQRISRWNFKEFWQVSGSRGRAREEPAATPLAPANQCVAPVGDLLINDKTRLLLLLLEPTTVGSLWLENDLHENELEFESHMGEDRKKCPRYFRRDSRGNPRDLNMCCTGRSAAQPRRRKSMPPIGVLMKRESMKLVVQQRNFT